MFGSFLSSLNSSNCLGFHPGLTTHSHGYTGGNHPLSFQFIPFHILTPTYPVFIYSWNFQSIHSLYLIYWVCLLLSFLCLNSIDIHYILFLEFSPNCLGHFSLPHTPLAKAQYKLNPIFSLFHIQAAESDMGKTHSHATNRPHLKLMTTNH